MFSYELRDPCSQGPTRQGKQADILTFPPLECSSSTPSRILVQWCSGALLLAHQLPRPSALRVTMRTTARQTHENRTITVDFLNEAPSMQLLHAKAAHRLGTMPTRRPCRA